MSQNRFINLVKEYFNGIWQDRYVLINLVRQDLQVRYNRSALGVAWSIITPLGLSIIIGMVYSIIYGVSPVEFIPILFSGLNPWLLINNSADGGTVSYIVAEGYLKQTRVHAQIFPLRGVFVAFVNFLYSMVAFFCVYLFLKPDAFGIRMLLFFVGAFITFIASWGMANLSSIITLYLRDFQPLQSLLLQGVFYVTPIIYTTEMLDAKGFSMVYKLNPFFYLIDVVRAPALATKYPSINEYLIATAIALGIFSISIVVTMKHSKTIALKL